ncbi:GIP [Symbiodinium sp. CCMP2592]|nr:GIP [Symbiodinium sp. CCMP2592]
MAENPGAAQPSSQLPLQQGMSPTPFVDGEQQGPDYSRLETPQLRGEDGRQHDAAARPNGVMPRSQVPGSVGGAAAASGIDEDGPRGHDHDREVRVMTGRADNQMIQDPLQGETGPASSVHELTAHGRDGTMFDRSGAPLFEGFSPSPLPGQSPMTVPASSTGRPSTWFTRLGDYIQRRVEVTAWSTPPHGATTLHGTAWPRPDAGVMMSSSTHMQAAATPPGRNADSVSSGSAGVSAELVQAEVARQLESAVGGIMDRLHQERQRTEEATLEAQRLRQQLEVQELHVHRLRHSLPPGPLSGVREGDEDLRHCKIVCHLEIPNVAGVMLLKFQVLVGFKGNSFGMLLLRRAMVLVVEMCWVFNPEFQQNNHYLDYLDLAVGVEMIRPPLQPPPMTPTPMPPSLSAGPGSADSNLLATLAKGIEALLVQQQSTKSDKPEAVKPGINELPALPEYQPLTGSIDLLHWITHIGPIMEDLSDTSSIWWQATMKAALSWYDRYSSSAPLARLQLTPEASSELQRPEWARVERRATAMMLSAVPRGVREEVIAHGHVSSLCLLCKLYAVYQPGNLQEKALVLKMLEQPDECSTALGAVEGLRKWSLWRKRAMSIGMAEPDASVLLKGLDKITGPIVRANYELSFRVSLIRSTLQVDVSPSATTVTTFLQHLQAEMEQQDGRGCVAEYNHDFGAYGPLGLSDVFAAEESGTERESVRHLEADRRVNFDPGEIQAKVLQVMNEISHLPVFARDVHVQLAGDAVTAMKQTLSGSLLSSEELAQVIVPLGKVISNLGYKLDWTAEHCVLHGEDGEQIPLQVTNGCPEVSEAVAQRLIHRLETQKLPELQESTQASAKMLKKLKASWWACMDEYVKSGDLLEAKAAVDKAIFIENKDVVKERLLTRQPRPGVWELMKELALNRRARKRLLRAEAWILRWDPPTVERSREAVKHLSFLGGHVYINMNTLLVDNEFADVWKVIQWAAFKGMISAMVVKDCPGRPWDQLMARPHRSKFLFLHALASVARQAKGGGAVRMYVEDLDRKNKACGCSSEDGKSGWPAWSQQKDVEEYMSEMGLVDVSIQRFTGERHVRLAKMSSDAAWRLHVARNHQPFRRDCAVCVRNSAAGHQHRATAHPMAYSLSVDVVGPLKGYGRSPDGKFFKYFVIGAFRIPKVDGGHGHGEVQGYPLPPGDPDEEEQWLSEDEGDPGGDGGEAGGVTPDDVEDEKKKWEDLKATFKEPIQTTTLYFAIPVNNKKAATMLPAVQRIVADVKSLGFPVTRMHSDRGGEFRGHLVRKWALAQGMWPTTTSGSDSAANGVAESGVRYLKRRARILLDGSHVSKENWPTAVQYAAAQQRAEALGSLPSMPVAYGTKVYVKTKRYKTGAVEDFGPHWTQGRYVGPSTDIRGGHVILKSSGTFIQTTHVRVTRDPPALDEVAPTVIVESDHDDPPGEEPPLPPPLLPPPAHRMRSKGPSAARLDGFYEDFEDYGTIKCDESSFEEETHGIKYLRVGEIEYVEGVARRMCERGTFTERESAKLLSLFAGTCGNLKVPRAPAGTGMILGAFVHGGSFGVTRYGRDLPWVTQFFNAFMMKKIRKNWPTLACSWTTLAIQAATEIPRHRDLHNERGSYNYALELKTESVEGLWVQDHGMERPVVGGTHAQDYQYKDADGRVHEGCVVKIDEKPAVFDPLVHHAFVDEGGMRWFLSAYTPQGAYKLGEKDQQYLSSLKFPLANEGRDDVGSDGALETRPALKAVTFPSPTTWSRAHGVEGDDVEAATVGECEATLWDWALYVEDDLVEEEADAVMWGPTRLKRVCSSDDPGLETEGLLRTLELLSDEEIDGRLQMDLAQSAEHCAAFGLHDQPRLAKLEPEYVEDIEGIIKNAVDTRTPLRHTYNVSPQDAKKEIDKWKPAIAKEVGVIEKGFVRIHANDIPSLKAKYAVQELPSKLVYTVKPPAEDTGDGSEASCCKRKARIVCCGNYADEEQNDLFAGGAAAESLRCSLTYAVHRRWRSGIVDITGAFMLTPLERREGQTVYIIRPPAVLIQLGLAEPHERWMLTHGMYGLRQSPKLWASYRDGSLSSLEIEAEEKIWTLKQGQAEPNLWLVYEVGSPVDASPEALVLVYVDDILIAGPLWLLRAIAGAIGRKWKISELDVLSAEHNIRFLGCEIVTNEPMTAIFVHQQPYIEEILRLHEISPAEQSLIQAPRETVTFEAFEDRMNRSDKLSGSAVSYFGWLSEAART